MNTEVRFSVAGGEEVSREYKRIQESADQFVRDAVRSSREYTTSGKEVVSNLEEQLGLMRERNRLDAKFRMESVRAGITRGVTTPEEGKRAITQIRQETAQDDLQIKVMKDILETVKQNAKDELRADRDNVERQLKNDESLNRRGLDENADELDALKKSIQRQKLGELIEEEGTEAAGISGRGIAAAGIHLGTMGLTRNPYAAAMSALALIPMIGGALSSIGQAAVSAAQGYQTAIGANVSISGGPFEGFENFGEGGARYGFTMTDALNMRLQASRARGRGVGAGEIFDLQTLERGAGLDQGLLMQMTRGQRFGVDDLSVSEEVQTLIRSLQGTGLFAGGDLSTLPEYLQQLVSLGEQQLQVSGEINAGVNIKTITALTNLDESFKNPTLLRNLIASISGGLSGAPNEITRNLQFMALSRTDPGAGLLELEEARENPLKNIKYFQNFLQVLKESSGGDEEMFIRNIRGTLTSSVAMARKVAAGFEAGNLTELITTGGGVDLGQRAVTATGEMMTASARVSNRLSDMGETLVKQMTNLVKGVDDLSNSMKKVAVNYEKAQNANLNAVRALEESNSILSNMLGGLARGATFNAF